MTNRRQFFKHFLTEIIILKDEFQGHRHFKLSDLWKYSDEQFGKLKFRIRPDVTIEKGKQEIKACVDNKNAILLCHVPSLQAIVFGCIEKQKSVTEITSELTKIYNQDQECTLNDVRNFILSLVKEMICIPVLPIVSVTEEREYEG